MQVVRPPKLDSLEDLLEFVLRLNDIMLGAVGFGVPDDGTGVAAGDNMLGVWVTASFSALDTDTTVTHNLGIPTNSSGTPNVRWLNFGVEHDGTGVSDGTSCITINYETGAAVTTNAIDLRAYESSGNRTVSTGSPITAWLFLVPAVI